jgi:hypothetical protein
MLTSQDLHQFVIDRRRDRDYAKLCEAFHETDSLYVDPIFGAYRGRQAITDWLVPIMGRAGDGKAGNTSYDDVAEALLIGDASFVEWRQLAHLPGGETKELVRGCGIRRYGDGAITFAADYFDTCPLRQRAAAAIGEAMGATLTRDDISPAASDLSWQLALRRPRERWDGPPPANAPGSLTDDEIARLESEAGARGDFGAICDLFHPTESVYIDPLFGRFEGQQAIRDWLVPTMKGAGRVVFTPVAPVLTAPGLRVTEWLMVATLEDGSEVALTRGCSVRRMRDGWMVYAADYFDTWPLRRMARQGIGERMGATIGPQLA